MLRLTICIFTLAISHLAVARSLFIEKEYDSFKVLIDCRNRGAITYSMTLGPDQGNEPRLHKLRYRYQYPHRVPNDHG
jgi:hypothetical protein